ncbi:MAG TPA: glycoside hydrolase family protein [Polyangia bacterium]
MALETFTKIGLTLALVLGCTTSGAQRDDAAVGTGGSASGGESGSGGSGGGAQATGGSSGTGGVAASGGARGSGGAPGTGGATASGGARGTGGASATGGATAAGGAKGAGGMKGTGGASGGANGSAGASGACKRGIATNTAPGAAFFPAVRWWYDWSNQGGGTNTGIEFVPMIWGSASVNSAIPTASKFLLTFNEPNFHAQSNLTAAQAASYWPTLQAKAMTAGIPIVSPGMNFCGPDSACNGTSPYQYLKDFFAACAGCQVDYVAVHWYNCDLPSLKDYLEPGGSLEGFEQFGKPIWLTEFSCDGSASAAEQEAFMRVAVPYLESKANVFRYSWFSASNIPNGQLVNSDGSPTALGQVYIGLPGSCP